MFTPKYYAAIEQAQRKTQALPEHALLPFNLDDLGADSWARRAKVWLTGLLLPPILALLRRFWPVARIGRIVIVTRAKHVADVLARPDAFEVPYGREMKELAGGTDFVLGIEGCPHHGQNKIIGSVLKESDAELVREMSNRFARALIRTSGGRIDVMKDLITRVASETCIRYFGLRVDDPDAFAEWAMSVSALLFADPFGAPATRQLALNGAARLRIVIDRSIRSVADAKEPYPDTVLGRLLALEVSHDEIRAILIGLVTGFIPTNTLAAGKILQELLRRPDAMQEATKAARRARKADENRSISGTTENPDLAPLQAVLLEAARLNPALAPGQWRYATREALIAPDGERPRKVLQDSVLMVSTMSALRDSQALDFPGEFKLDREPGSAGLMFGAGTHACLGKHLALAQITEIFMILLSQANLRRPKWSLTWWRGIRWVGPFPRWFDMEFDPETAPATQTMMTICAPLSGEADRTDIENRIAQLKNPATQTMRTMLDSTDIVHFASLSLFEAGDAREPAPHLLLELNVDGPADAALRSIADADAAAGNNLRSIFANTPLGEIALADVLRHYTLDLRTRPWGAIGLTFNGTSGFSVPDIAKQDELATFAREALNYNMHYHARFGSRAMAVLDYVRAYIRQSKGLVRASESERYRDRAKIKSLLERGAKFADFLIVPSRKRLPISEWKERTRWQALGNFLKSWPFWRLFLPVIAIALLLGVLVFHALGTTTLIGIYGRIILAVIGSVVASLFLWGLVAAGFLALLRYHENRDVPDDENPELENIRKIAGVENPRGFAHNHFMAVTELKSGWFRKLTLALALWGINQSVANLFRPGFVLNMGTIHYAKWFRLPGRDKLIFQANYDGSWESYLEDFIMKAHIGQTAAWCNGVGFPRTKWLVRQGAQDGDRFKRWVRRQQVIAQFWYSRFPHLTTDQIRNNALIHDGLARATTDTAARAWLDCFGSMPRPDYAIETEEVQSLLFRGQRILRYGVCALIQLRDTKQARCWLKELVPQRRRPPDYLENCRITFGDNPFTSNPELQDTATFVAFSAAGLDKLGVPSRKPGEGLTTFPNSFNLGMANRSSILGDFNGSAPTGWYWRDADEKQDTHPLSGDTDPPRRADAILLIYAKSIEDCKTVLQYHVAALGDKNPVFHEVYTRPVSKRIEYEEPEPKAEVKPVDERADKKSAADKLAKNIDYEHFGFHDGISQPVIRGTQRFSKGVQPRDIVEPGEFILGYRNNQKYYPPTATVSAESDWRKHLPTPLTDIPSRFPSFENSDTARDFGRNGSFLVVRQLAQDVDGFRTYTDAKAEQLREDYPKLSDVVGAPINAKWVAAKMMGRWPDGTPLVARPGADKGEYPRKYDMRDNDFSYGTDDPQGLHCPFGAHIRRANPRDSMQPEDPMQQLITNRHRLLRRGRTYEYEPKQGETEKGLLFTCLCADLDRQFEFVQQTWIGSPSFHGLRNEVDPMVAWQGSENIFTIPTPAGPVRMRDMKSYVTVKAGGYFFLPSRSAILYLANLRSDGSENAGD